MTTIIRSISLIIGCCLFLFLETCSSNPDEHGVPAFKVDAKAKAVIENASMLEDILEPVAEIQLENSDEALVGKVSELFVGPEEQFIIIDRPMRRMLIFNRLGRWLHTVTYDDILGPGKKYTRMLKAVFWSQRELLVSFLNIPYLYIVNLDSPSSVEKILIKKGAHILDFAITSNQQFLTLIRDYYGNRQKQFRLLDRNGRIHAKFKEISSSVFPNLSVFFPFDCLSRDTSGFVYYSNAIEAKIYRYDDAGKLQAVLSRKAPFFNGPSNDIPAGLNASIKKRLEDVVKSLLFKYFVLRNGIIIVIYDKDNVAYYDFGGINGEWLKKPFKYSRSDDLYYIRAVSGNNLYSIIAPKPDDVGNFGNPKIGKMRISENSLNTSNM